MFNSLGVQVLFPLNPAIKRIICPAEFADNIFPWAHNLDMLSSNSRPTDCAGHFPGFNLWLNLSEISPAQNVSDVPGPYPPKPYPTPLHFRPVIAK